VALTGGVMMMTSGEGREVLFEVLHDRGKVREVPLHQKVTERAWRSGSPKGGSWWRSEHGATVLRWMADDVGSSGSFSEVQGTTLTCSHGRATTVRSVDDGPW
jgi:hypothetical protein